MIIIKYVGSKNRISKDIIPIIQSLINENQVKIYFEPFVGGCNLIDKIQCDNRVGNDCHKELIALLTKVQAGWIPPDTISEEEYNQVRENKEKYPDYYVGLVGFCATFGGKYFGGFARGKKADGTPRDYFNESIRNLLKQAPKLKGIKLLCKDYLEIDMSTLHNALIYVDPPYKGVTKYSTEKFDYDRFYDWCRKVAKTNILCVSEYQMPEDFKCIWCKNVNTSLDVSNKRHQHEDRTEKLFMLNPEKYNLPTLYNDETM